MKNRTKLYANIYAQTIFDNRDICLAFGQTFLEEGSKILGDFWILPLLGQRVKHNKNWFLNMGLFWEKLFYLSHSRLMEEMQMCHQWTFLKDICFNPPTYSCLGFQT